jgi:hypothetical protein
VPRDNEENKPIFSEARNLLHEILRRGLIQLETSDDEDDETEPPANEKISDLGWK